MDDKSTPARDDEWEAQILAMFKAYGVDTEKFPIQFVYGKEMRDWRKPIAVGRDGGWSFTAEAIPELRKIPAFKESWDARMDKIAEIVADSIAERMRTLKYALLDSRSRIADLPIAQASDPALAEDTILSTLIANLGEAFEALADHIQQLTPVELAEPKATKAKSPKTKTAAAKTPEIRATLANLELHLKGLVRALQHEGGLLTDHGLIDDLYKAIGAYNAVCEHVALQSTEPSDLP